MWSLNRKPSLFLQRGFCARLARFERAAFRLGGERSILLSYRRIVIRRGSAVYKPSSVLTAIYLRVQSPVRSSETTEAGEQPVCFLSCTGWGLHDGRVARPPVRSYRTFPPLPIDWRYISVALALESPPPAVSWHPCSVVLGLSSSSALRRNPRLPNRLSLRTVLYTQLLFSSM